MSELNFHALAEIFPLLEGSDFNALITDIAAHGLHEPIVVYEDKILDGRNRYRACIAAGVEPFTAYSGFAQQLHPAQKVRRSPKKPYRVVCRFNLHIRNRVQYLCRWASGSERDC